MNWVRPQNLAKSMTKMLFNVLSVSIPSLIIFFLLLELVLPLLIPITQPVGRSFNEKWSLVTLTPDQEGTIVHGFRQKIKYRTNSEGWNSLRDYSPQKNQKIRIAVIGDSYVQAFQVDIEKAFPDIMERNLSDQGYEVEIYRFGISGAPLSQYLYMMEYVYNEFRPDIAIVNVIYNDFDESLHDVGLKKYGVGNNHFWTLKQTENSFRSVPPDKPTNKKIMRLLEKSRLMRFLFYQMHLKSRIIGFINAQKKDEEVEQNVRMSVLESEKTIFMLTRHIFSECQRLSDDHKVKLLLVIDAPRQYIYENIDPREAKVYRFNEISLNLANEMGIEIIDLTDAFGHDYEINQQRFNSETDGHWDERGNWVVAQAITEFLVERNWLKRSGG